MIKNYQKARLLEGTWGRNDTWGQFTVRIRKSGISVSACDSESGEVFPVSGVKWDGEQLTFDFRVPSMGWKLTHQFMPNRGASVKKTSIFKETLTRQKPTRPSSVRR